MIMTFFLKKLKNKYSYIAYSKPFRYFSWSFSLKVLYKVVLVVRSTSIHTSLLFFVESCQDSLDILFACKSFSSVENLCFKKSLKCFLSNWLIDSSQCLYSSLSCIVLTISKSTRIFCIVLQYWKTPIDSNPNIISLLIIPVILLIWSMGISTTLKFSVSSWISSEMHFVSLNLKYFLYANKPKSENGFSGDPKECSSSIESWYEKWIKNWPNWKFLMFLKDIPLFFTIRIHDKFQKSVFFSFEKYPANSLLMYSK